MKYRILLYFMCCFGFFITYALFDQYADLYHIPFGMSDIDTYMCWWDQTTYFQSCCNIFDAFTTHWLIHYLVLFLGEPLDVINILVPVLLWVFIPCGVFFFSYAILRESEAAASSTVLFVFGTFTVFFYGICGLWSQLLAFVFLLPALAFYVLEMPFLFLFFAFLSCATHPFMFFVLGLLILSELIHYRLYWLLGVGVAVGLGVCWYLGLNIIAFTVPFSEYFPHDSLKVEPNLYTMFFVFTNPVLVLFFLFGVLNTRPRLFWFIVLLSAVTPFSQLGRGLMFWHLFVSVYGYVGFRMMLVKHKHKAVILCVLMLFFFLHYESMLSYFLDNMVYEMGLRGFNPNFLKDLINYPK